MKPNDLRRLKRAAWRVHERGDVTDDPNLLDKALTHLVKLDAIEAAATAAEATAAAAVSGGTGITIIERVIVDVRDSWEQHLTQDERAQLEELREAARHRRSAASNNGPSDDAPAPVEDDDEFVV